MNVLLIGSGGREHAIAWRISQSPLLSKLWIAPGNAGTAALGENVEGVSPTDPEAVRALAEDIRADLVVVSSDDPPAAGVIDAVTAAGIPAFGSTKAAAEIEFEGRAAVDLPTGVKAGQSVKVRGASFFEFRGPLLCRIADYS